MFNGLVVDGFFFSIICVSDNRMCVSRVVYIMLLRLSAKMMCYSRALNICAALCAVKRCGFRVQVKWV